MQVLPCVYLQIIYAIHLHVYHIFLFARRIFACTTSWTFKNLDAITELKYEAKQKNSLLTCRAASLRCGLERTYTSIYLIILKFTIDSRFEAQGYSRQCRNNLARV